MFQHHYLLALDILRQGRILLCENFSADEDKKNWKLLNQLMETKLQNSDMVRKIFFLEEASKYLNRIQEAKSIVERDGSLRTLCTEDISIACKGICKYLDSDLSIFTTYDLNNLQKSQYEFLLQTDLSMDNKIERIRNKILLEKNNFEKLFEKYDKQHTE